jgi:hypothetical protein
MVIGSEMHAAGSSKLEIDFAWKRVFPPVSLLKTENIALLTRSFVAFTAGSWGLLQRCGFNPLDLSIYEIKFFVVWGSLRFFYKPLNR